MKIKSGFLIVKKFEKLYCDYVHRYELERPVYAIPRIDLSPEESPIKYRGLDRDALNPYRDSKILAEVFLATDRE